MSEDSKFDFRTRPESAMTIPEAWKVLEKLAVTLRKPGHIQHDIIHSPQGAAIEKARKTLMHVMVDECNACKHMTETSIAAVGVAVRDHHRLYLDYINDLFDLSSEALQVIPLKDLLVEGHVKGEEGVPAEQQRLLDSVKTEEGKTVFVAKPHPVVALLFSIAHDLLGSKQAMIEAQQEIINSFPEEERRNLPALFAAQVVGCLSKGIGVRVQSKYWAEVHVMAVLEGYEIFLRTLSLPFIADWNANGTEILRELGNNSADHIERRLAELEGVDDEEGVPMRGEADAPLVSEPHPGAKPTSTQFAGTRTIN